MCGRRVSIFGFSQMLRCVSFVHSRRHSFSWSRCARRARRGDVFCSLHRDALDGAVLGAFHATESFHVNETEIQRAGLDAASAKIALECALAVLTVPHGAPKGRRPENGREEKCKASGAVADSSPTALPPQTGANG
jgi:hypothetical protein